MKVWLRPTLLLTLAVLLALVLREHAGNVIIVAPPWRVELSLVLAVVLIAVLFLVLHGLLRGLNWLILGPQRVRHWRSRRAQHQDRISLEQGWTGVLEGRNHEAEQQLSRLLARTRSPDTKVLAALALARSQHNDGRYSQRDETLAQARSAAAGQTRLQEAVAVVHAELLLTQQQAEPALQLLQTVFANNPKALNITQLLLQAYWQLAQYPKVYELTRLLQRKGAIKPEQARGYLEKAIAAQLAALENSAAANAKASFKALWADLKREEKLWPSVALQAAKLHNQHGEARQASKTLEAALTQTLDAQLLDAYSHCAPQHVAQRVAKAEDWLKTSPDHVELLIALGKLCLQGQLWGAGERYLQRSLKLPASARQHNCIHALLGKLHDSLGQTAQALHHWRLAAGVEAAMPSHPSVLPAADTRDDPGSLDGEADIDARHAPLPQAASAADYLDEDSRGQTPARTNADANGQTSLEAGTEDDLYFDSAVIPGVDLSQTSDRSGTHGDIHNNVDGVSGSAAPAADKRPGQHPLTPPAAAHA